MSGGAAHQVRRVQLVTLAKPGADVSLWRALLAAVAKGSFAALAVIGLLFVGVLVGDNEPAQRSAPRAAKVTT